jgi:L-aspartate oxidase
VTAAAPVRRILVAGSGIAGLYTALLARTACPTASITVVTKGAVEESNTWYAQGGISAVLPANPAGDTVASHVADTLAAGTGFNDPAAVELLCRDAAGHIERLVRAGAAFDRAAGGGFAFGREAAHAVHRILHVDGDSTGAGVAAALIRAVRAAGVDILEHTFLAGLLTDGGAVCGAQILAARGPHAGAVREVEADAVVLATGGAGQLFEHNTNPEVATADGFAAAWRAGAVVKDVEFYQFHPTALDVPGNFMISEAVRGEGAVLRDADGHRFMPGYHPDAELAPRDVVSRSIAQHLKQNNDGGRHVYLDATGVAAARGTGFLARRFPMLTRRTRELGFDWETDLLPVVPAAHYWMGGVQTDLWARTSLRGLYAVGEVACTGVHGANRLASNSLLEGLVFAGRAVAALAGGAPEAWPAFTAQPLDLPEPAGADRGEAAEPVGRAQLQRLMADNAAVVRDDAGLAVAAKQLAAWQAAGGPGIAECETGNLLLTAQLLVHAARRRTESFGAHYRSDYPQRAGSEHRAYVRSQETQ